MTAILCILGDALALVQVQWYQNSRCRLTNHIVAVRPLPVPSNKAAKQVHYRMSLAGWWETSSHTVPTNDFRFLMWGLGEDSLKGAACFALLLPSSDAEKKFGWEREVVERNIFDDLWEVSSVRSAATPRSPRSTVPSSSMRRFAALISRCMNPLTCR